MRTREAPSIRWRAVTLGLIVALGIGVVASVLGTGLPGGLIGLAAGGYLAGRYAVDAPALHGALVAALWIVLLALAPFPEGSAGVVEETVATVVADILYLAAGAGGGWLAGTRRR